MRKDFLVEPVQVREARKAGASGILLIATILSDAKLREMLDVAWQHGMFVLLESFDEEDLADRHQHQESAHARGRQESSEKSCTSVTEHALCCRKRFARCG